MRWRWRPPAEVAVRIARTLLWDPVATGEPPPRAYPLTGFQEDAVRRARGALARRGGVVVADEVGLGKTYVALALMEEELRRGGGVALVLPAALVPTWTPLVRRLARLTGRPGAVYATTHTRLSRGSHDAARLAGAGLVVVDEAHAFRNPATRRYRALAARGPGSRVLLITATPVNNATADLYHLVRQFASDDAFRDVGVASLRGAFLDGAPDGARRERRARPGAGQGEEAMRVVREVVIRRTRDEVGPVMDGSCVAPRGDVPARFPARAPTRILRYDDPRVPALVAGIQRLELPPYEGTVDALLRLGLLKRLESGSGALAASLRRLRALLVEFARAAEAGRLLRPADRPGRGRGGRDGGGGGDPPDGDAIQLVLDALVLDAAPPGTDLPTLAASARRDLETVAAMLRRMKAPDPKLAVLRQWAKARPRGEKAVIFTEFRDTAAAIARDLLPLGHVGRVDGGGAWLGARQSGRRAVVERFAPVSSGVRRPPDRERVDLLVATDVLGVGLNLQDAAVVVCYDLPWNPVRLLQRIGRVDRLGSLHDRVQPILFVPGTGLDDVLRLTRSLRAKLGDIAGTVGATDAGELLERLGSGGGAASAPDPLDALARFREADPWERLRTRVDPVGPRADDPARPLLGAAADDSRARGAGWLVLARGPAGRPELVAVDPQGRVRPGGPEEVRALERVMEESSDGPDGGADLRAVTAEAAAAAALRHVAGRARAATAPPPLGRHGPEARLAGEVRRALASLGPAPDPALLRRADAVLRRLGRPLGPAALAALERECPHDGRRAASAARPPELRRLLDSVHEVLDRTEVRTPRNARELDASRGVRGCAEGEILAVLSAPPGTPR